MSKKVTFAVSALAAVLGLAVASEASAATTLRFATLAPKNSSFGKGYVTLAKAVEKVTEGQLTFEVFYNGVSGMEGTMVSKMKTGQLDGGVLTTLGLASINPHVGVMSLPGLVDTWDKLDKVRDGTKDELSKGFESAGFKVLGWGDVGLVRGFSKGFAIHRPSDIRGKSPMVYRDERVGPIFFSILGGVTPVPLSIMEILPALRSGQINLVSAPALAAEQLQWTPHFDHVSDRAIAIAVGGAVIRQKSLDALPADVRDKFLKINERFVSKNKNEIRKLDDEAFLRVSKKMTLVKITEEDKKEWEDIMKKALTRLSKGTYPEELMKKVANLAGYKL